jgi:hypothetical protein
MPPVRRELTVARPWLSDEYFTLSKSAEKDARRKRTHVERRDYRRWLSTQLNEIRAATNNGERLRKSKILHCDPRRLAPVVRPIVDGNGTLFHDQRLINEIHACWSIRFA